jgi:hypothetical protein
MLRHRSAGWICDVNTDNTVFEIMAQFKYVGRTNNYDDIQEQIMISLLSGNGCYISVENICFPYYVKVREYD